MTTSAMPISRCGSGCSSCVSFGFDCIPDDWRGCEVVGCDNEEEKVDGGWEGSEGIAIRTVTFTVEGELELSSVIEIFVEWALDPLLAAGDEAGRGEAGRGGFKNVLARVNKEG